MVSEMSRDKTVGIRVDVNETIATGHAMRCLSIAKQIEKLGEKVVMIVADEASAQFLSNYTYPIIILRSNWQKLEEELVVLQKVIEEEKIGFFFIDSYFATDFYLATVKQWTKVGYIDDLLERKVELDLILNYAHYASLEAYSYVQDKNSLMLGSKYAPLREEFSDGYSKWQDKVEHIFITTGGTDQLGVSLALLKEIERRKAFSSITFHVIVGKLNQYKKEIKALTDCHSNMIYYENTDKMAQIMKQCQLAISAGGTTLLELCALRVPTICFAIADNQLMGIQSYANSEIMVSLGDIREQLDTYGAKCINQVEELVNHPEKRKRYWKNMVQEVDGTGARMVAERIVMFL